MQRVIKPAYPSLQCLFIQLTIFTALCHLKALCSSSGLRQGGSLPAVHCAISHGWLFSQEEKGKQALTAKRYFRRGRGESRNKQRDRQAKKIFLLFPSICSIIAPINRLIGLAFLCYPCLPFSPSLYLCSQGAKKKN